MGRKNLLALGVLAAVALVACGDDDDATGASPGDEGGVATISTAPELEPVVTELIQAYGEASGAGLELTVVPPDEVIQAVSEGTPAILPGAWLGDGATDSIVIGRNLAIIVVPAANPAEVTGLDAFAPESGLDTAICGADSSYGNLATLVLERAGVTPDPMRVGVGCDADAVARVAGGELDAALVFRGSVEMPDGVEVVNVPEEQNIVIDVRYAPVGDAEDTNSNSFAQFLQSDQAEQILTLEGFLP